ncbi:MAG: hypothetical protein U9N53_09930, partial [Bacteroidota bacterium]|nr:hypothetical protein [Bacteroidota bacterium]
MFSFSHSSLNTLFAQAPQKFNYQAVARNGNAILENASLDVKLEILQGSTTGTMVWTETQTDVTTNDYGLFSIQAGSENEISIDWNDGPYFLKVQVDIGTGFQDFGNSELLSVPYALNTQSVSSLEKLDILGPADMDPDSALFEVKRNDGQTIFAVYNSGVRMFVEEGESKGRRGGFAIGGFTPGKGETGEYFRVTPDSVRIYLDTTTAKRPKGGFAIGGFTPGKDGDEDGDHYFNVFTQSEAGVINPSQPRILWYPKKEAFLTGRVLIESPDSVGTNSLATGFESKSIGDYSQALGYKARAKGNNSTAIGNNANAAGIASYAFGNYAMAQDSGSYAIGSGATASGLRSFALGSTGLDLAGIAITPTMAIGNYAYAFGMGSVASGQGAFALGTKNSAIGDYSIAMGYNTQAIGGYSAAIGLNAIASGGVSLSIGNSTTASAGSSTALGFRTTASGDISTATGYNTTASGDYSTAMGTSNEASGMMSTAMGAGT